MALQATVMPFYIYIKERITLFGLRGLENLPFMLLSSVREIACIMVKVDTPYGQVMLALLFICIIVYILKIQLFLV